MLTLTFHLGMNLNGFWQHSTKWVLYFLVWKCSMTNINSSVHCERRGHTLFYKTSNLNPRNTNYAVTLYTFLIKNSKWNFNSVSKYIILCSMVTTLSQYKSHTNTTSKHREHLPMGIWTKIQKNCALLHNDWGHNSQVSFKYHLSIHYISTNNISTTIIELTMDI